MAISPQQRAAAQLESFTTKAVAVLVLYWVGWLPGFIANAVFYSEARRKERIAGRQLEGTGCLATMLWLNVGLLALGLLAGACFLASIRISNG